MLTAQISCKGILSLIVSRENEMCPPPVLSLTHSPDFPERIVGGSPNAREPNTSVWTADCALGIISTIVWEIGHLQKYPCLLGPGVYLRVSPQFPSVGPNSFSFLFLSFSCLHP